MNRDQAKGHMKDMAGKARQKIGALTGSRKQQAKGAAKQAVGKTHTAVGKTMTAASRTKAAAKKARARAGAKRTAKKKTAR